MYVSTTQLPGPCVRNLFCLLANRFLLLQQLGLFIFPTLLANIQKPIESGNRVFTLWLKLFFYLTRIIETIICVEIKDYIF